MKALTITFLLALALTIASCGGGNTTQATSADSQSADSTKNIETIEETADEPSTTDETADSVVIQVARILAAQEDNPLTEDDVKLYIKTYISTSDLYNIYDFQPQGFKGYGVSIHCYPYNTGGYYVLVIWNLKGIRGNNEYHSYSFKGGKLTETQSPLPTPGMDDFFSNADQFPKDAYDEIKNRIPFYEYNRYYEKMLVSFNCFEYVGGKSNMGYKVPKPLQTYFNALTGDEGHYRGMPCLKYRWDGEKFILDTDSDNKPFKEDLTYFGMTAPHGEFAQSSKTIEDLYSLDKDFLCTGNSDFNQDDIEDLVAGEKHGGLMAIYFGGENGYTLFKTYEVKNDIVIDAWKNRYGSYLEIHNQPKDKPSIIYTMQYLDNDFYLVSGSTAKTSGKYEGKFGRYDFEEHTWTPINDLGSEDTTKTIPIANKPLKNLSDFTIGEYQFEDYN